MERTTEREIRCPYCDGFGKRETIVTSTSVSFRPQTNEAHRVKIKTVCNRCGGRGRVLERVTVTHHRIG